MNLVNRIQTDGKIFEKSLDFLGHDKYNIVVARKVGDMVSPRTGRPKSENPKGIEVKARIDAETDMRLQDYCRKHNKTRTDVVREGIELILGQKK